MDWTNRGNRPQQPVTRPASQNANQPSLPAPATNEKTAPETLGSMRWATGALLISIGVLLVALVSYLVFGNHQGETRFVDKSKMQAVFLTNDQVYFGHISELNDRYVRMHNIYYLRAEGQLQPGQNQNPTENLSLAKLGCFELHKPQDHMVINRAHVTFWENLQDDSRVVQAVKEYINRLPEGQRCLSEQSAADSDSTAEEESQDTSADDTSNDE